MSGRSNSFSASFPRQALLVVAAVVVFKLVVAAGVPLTGDEAYYWVWSRHLAYGYLDHPPMVAWLIAAASWLGHSSVSVRLPFILCEAGAALLAGQTALALSGSAPAALAATVLLALVPQPRSMLGEVRPDAPYMLCWAASLLLVARAQEKMSLRAFALLGLAFAGAILSRFFGWAVIIGIVFYALAPQHRALWRRGLWLSLAIACILYIPFLVWNAHHNWMNLSFTVAGRHQAHELSFQTFLQFSTLRTVVFTIVLWFIAIRVAIRPGYSLLAWTALPLATFLALSSVVYPLESNYLLGPFTSLSVGIGIAWAQWPKLWQRIASTSWVTAGVYTMLVVLFAALPERVQAKMLSASHGALKGIAYSEVFRYRPLAADVNSLAREPSDAIVTEAFETASELEYYGVHSRIAGTTLQSAQWRIWDGEPNLGGSVLVVTSAPLDQIEPLADLTTRACAKVYAGPILHYMYAGTSAGTFFTTWCRRPSGDAGRSLLGG